MDWFQRGLRDGSEGLDISELSRLKKQCAAYGIPADDKRYSEGRKEGLSQFCTFDSGYKWGYAGRMDRNVCPPESNQEFYRGYWAGKTRIQNWKMQNKMSEEVQHTADEARLRALNECYADSDCISSERCTENKTCSMSGAPCTFDNTCPNYKRCVSQLRVLGTITGTINVCQ